MARSCQIALFFKAKDAHVSGFPCNVHRVPQVLLDVGTKDRYSS
jgi:hypothetical protein